MPRYGLPTSTLWTRHAPPSCRSALFIPFCLRSTYARFWVHAFTPHHTFAWRTLLPPACSTSSHSHRACRHTTTFLATALQRLMRLWDYLRLPRDGTTTFRLPPPCLSTAPHLQRQLCTIPHSMAHLALATVRCGIRCCWVVMISTGVAWRGVWQTATAGRAYARTTRGRVSPPCPSMPPAQFGQIPYLNALVRGHAARPPAMNSYQPAHGVSQGPLGRGLHRLF